MKSLTTLCALALCVLNVACGRGDSTIQTNQNSNSTADANRSAAGTAPKSRELGATSSHGGGPAATTSGGAAPASADGEADRALLNTAELDARIEKAVAKAKAPSASAADKKAAAAAHLERGNVYYLSGNPRLYKFALGDFRRVLRYAPENAEAKAKVKEIEDIYTYSVKKPIPNNGLEP